MESAMAGLSGVPDLLWSAAIAAIFSGIGTVVGYYWKQSVEGRAARKATREGGVGCEYFIQHHSGGAYPTPCVVSRFAMIASGAADRAVDH